MIHRMYDSTHDTSDESRRTARSSLSPRPRCRCRPERVRAAGDARRDADGAGDGGGPAGPACAARRRALARQPHCRARSLTMARRRRARAGPGGFRGTQGRKSLFPGKDQKVTILLTADALDALRQTAARLTETKPRIASADSVDQV